MTPRYAFEVDVPRSLVRVTMAGFFTPDDVIDFATARNDAHGQLRCFPNQHVTIVDIREMKIQSQDAVEQFQALLADRRHHARRIAFVVNSSLARTQIKRAAAGRGAEYFTSIGEAEAWLFNDAAHAA